MGLGVSVSQYFLFNWPSKTASVDKNINLEFIDVHAFTIFCVTSICNLSVISWSVSQRSKLELVGYRKVQKLPKKSEKDLTSFFTEK